MDEWVLVSEDEPQTKVGWNNVSVDVDVKCIDGKIIKNAFYGYKQQSFYNEHGKKIHDVITWRTSER